jgi:hypothetical protein
LELDYLYTRQWFQVLTPGGGYTSKAIAKFNGYAVTPSLFFVVRSNLFVTAGFSYMHQDVSANFPAGPAYDNYSPFICADEELLHFLPHVDTARNSLFLGGDFSYTRSIGSDGVFDKNSLAGNDYSFGPTLVYIRSLVDWSDGTPGRAAFTLNPAYTYNYMQSATSLGRSGVVTVLGRVDYGLTRNLYLNVFATWLHQHQIGVASSDNDLAFFGGGLAAKLINRSNHLVLFRLGYSYEAFMKQTESHEISAQVEFHF